MIKTGVNLIPEGPVARVVELAAEAERLGYQRCWVYDEGLATRDVYVTMTAIATATERIAIGPGITNAYTRHPATTSAAIASLDELSGHRAFLGLGAGGSLTLDPMGVDRSHPVQALRDTIAACRGLLAGNTVSIEGATFTLREARLGFPCRKDLEIWLAGRGPRMLQLGGELADGVMFDFVHKDRLGEYAGLVRGGAGRSGNRPRICYSTMVITDERALAETKPHMTYRLVDSPPLVREMLGISAGEVERIRRAMAGGLREAGDLVRDEWVLPFVISGSVDECAGELAKLMEQHSLDEFLLPVLDLDSAAELMGSVAAVVGG